jgi:hypothetical protein
MTTAVAPTLGIDHLDSTQAIVRRQVDEVQRAWRGLDPGGLRTSFAAGVAPVLVSAISTGQIDAAALATPYVSDVLADEPAQPLPTVVPSAFAGVTTTGLRSRRWRICCSCGCSPTSARACPRATPY